jgi:hypothetical protein
MYQKHVKQQEEGNGHLETELKAAKEEICKLKAGNVRGFRSNSAELINSFEIDNIILFMSKGL